MFGFGFKDKVKTVLRDSFNYPISGRTKLTLDEICKQAKQTGANEYDAAIMFMMVQMNILENTSNDVISFIKTHTENIKSIQPFASGTENQIAELLSQIHAKHGI